MPSPSPALLFAARFLPAAFLFLTFAPLAHAQAQTAADWIERAAYAARNYNYIGTIVYQTGARVESSRIVHMFDSGQEYEKLVNLDGPPREIVRTQNEVRCYYPDSKIIQVLPRTFRNVFPSLSPEQQQSLAQYYTFRVVTGERVGGKAATVVSFDPKDGFRYGHRFWSDAATGLLLKARMVNERGDVIEQFAFTDLTISAKVDRSMVEPSWPASPPEWKIAQAGAGDVTPHDTGWFVARIPAGFNKIMEGFRQLRGRSAPVAHLVYSDGLVAVSVFIEPIAGAPPPLGMLQQGGLNVYSVRLDDQVVTALGEAPGATVRQIANSVSRR